MTHPRSQPYTKAGLARLACAHCGAKAHRQWSLRPCAIGRTGWYPMCVECDVKLNWQVMEFLNVPDRIARIAAYTAPVRALPATQPKPCPTCGDTSPLPECYDCGSPHRATTETDQLGGVAV